jgi:RNA polymerase sigma-70 factor (ECF subfamily)
MDDRWTTFERSRRRLINIAARILGSADDAEDLVQEAALRWLQADLATVRTPEGWLVAVVTRLAVDRLRRTLTEQQAYREIGHLARGARPDWAVPDRPLEVEGRLADAFALLRDRLEPTERTAFVLRQMFDCGYDEIARMLGKSQVACRQIVHRARARLRQAPSRFAVRRAESPDLVRAFLEAVSTGDREAVLAVLTTPPPACPRPARRPAAASMGRPVRVLRWRRTSARASQSAWGRSLPASPAA